MPATRSESRKAATVSCVLWLALSLQAPVAQGTVIESIASATSAAADVITADIQTTTDKIATAVNAITAKPAAVANSLSESANAINAAMIAPFEAYNEASNAQDAAIKDIFTYSSPGGGESVSAEAEGGDGDYADYESEEELRRAESRPRNGKLKEAVRSGKMKRVRKRVKTSGGRRMLMA